MTLRLMFALGLATALAGAAEAADVPVVAVASPDGRNVISLALAGEGPPTYRVARDGIEVIASSPVQLELAAGQLGPGMALCRPHHASQR